jgi:hypothetical protein
MVAKEIFLAGQKPKAKFLPKSLFLRSKRMPKIPSTKMSNCGACAELSRTENDELLIKQAKENPCEGLRAHQTSPADVRMSGLQRAPENERGHQRLPHQTLSTECPLLCQKTNGWGDGTVLA